VPQDEFTASFPEPVRVIHVIHSGATGGGPRVLMDCVEMAASRGVENIVVCGSDGPLAADLQSRHVQTYLLSRTGKLSFAVSVPRLTRIFRSHSPSAVLLYGQFAGFYGAIASRLAGVPAVYEAHFPSFVTDAGPVSRLRNFVAEWVSCRLTRETTVVSESARAEYVRRGLQTATRLHLVANGVRTPTAEPNVIQSLRQRLLGDATHLVLAAGRMEDQKGFDTLLKAMPEIAEQHPGARLALVGDGARKASLEILASELGLSDVVSFHASQKTLDPWILASDTVVVPSRYEPGGLIAREAMAAGRVVVATDVQGLSEAIDSGRTGILVPPDDPQRLADAVIPILSGADMRDRMSSSARETATERFSREAMWLGYEAVIARLAGEALDTDRNPPR